MGAREPRSMCCPRASCPTRQTTRVTGPRTAIGLSCVVTPGIRPGTGQARHHCRWEKQRQKKLVRASSLAGGGFCGWLGSRAPLPPCSGGDSWLAPQLHADFPVCALHSPSDLAGAGVGTSYDMWQVGENLMRSCPETVITQKDGAGAGSSPPGCPRSPIRSPMPVRTKTMGLLVGLPVHVGAQGSEQGVWAPVLGEPLPELRGRSPAHSRTSPRAPSHVWRQREVEPQAMLCPCRMRPTQLGPRRGLFWNRGRFSVPAGPFPLPTWFSLAAAVWGLLGRRGAGGSH